MSTGTVEIAAYRPIRGSRVRTLAHGQVIGRGWTRAGNFTPSGAESFSIHFMDDKQGSVVVRLDRDAAEAFAAYVLANPKRS